MQLLGPYEMTETSEFARLPCLGCGSPVRPGEPYVAEQELGRGGWRYQVWHVRCPSGVHPPAASSYHLKPEE